MRSLNLASGAAHFKSPEAAVRQTVAALNRNETFYGEIAGLPALQEAIAARYAADFGITLAAGNILITAGTKQALFNLFSVLLQPGDEVILPEPSWFGFSGLFELLQVKTVAIPTNPAANYALEPTQIRNLITDKTKLFLYSNPGNPTGRVYSEEEIGSWLEVLQQYPQIKILSDEIYDLLVYEPVKIKSLLQFPDPHQQCLVVNGFSKNFGMSGWRIGYLLGPAAVIARCLDFQQTTISGVNPFIQEGAVAALQTRQAYLPGRLAELLKNRGILSRWLEQKPGITFFQPEGTYYIFAGLQELLKTPAFRRAGLDTTEKLCAYLLEKYRLEFVPGEKFGCPGFMRITFAVLETDLTEALERMDALLAEVQKPAAAGNL